MEYVAPWTVVVRGHGSGATRAGDGCGGAAASVHPPGTAAASAITATATRHARALSDDIRLSRAGSHAPPPMSSRLAGRGALGADVERVQRLAGRHEQAVPLWPAEAHVAADLGQPDATDELALGVPHRDPAVAHVAAGVA